MRARSMASCVMACVLTYRWGGLSASKFEELRQELMKEAMLPDTLRLQLTAVDGTDLVFTEVWESRSAADSFRNGRLALAARSVGAPVPPEPSGLELHRVLGPAGRPTAAASRRVLVVANQSIGNPDLEQKMRRMAASGPCVFHLLVPAGPLSPPTAEQDLEDPTLRDQLYQGAWEQARKLLDEHLNDLRIRGLDVTGEVGMADVVQAVRGLIDRRRFDEVILSTLPAGVSRWLGMDVPSRLRRLLDIPLTIITAESPD